MEHLRWIQYVAAQRQSPKFTVQIGSNTSKFQRKNSFHVDVQRPRDNEQECLANARLRSLYPRKFGKGQWSFIGPGSEKNWSLKKYTRNLGQHCRKDVVGIRRQRMSNFPCYASIVQR